MPIPSRMCSSRVLGVCLLLAALSACGGGAPGPTSGTGGNAAKRSNEQAANAGLSGNETVRGRIFGLRGTVATVTLGDQVQLLLTTLTDADGNFSFDGVPYGTFFVKAEAPGQAVSPAQVITVNPPTPLDATSTGALLPTLSRPAGMVFSATQASAASFSFHWDTTSGGQEASAHINAPPVIQYRNESITPPDTAAAAALYAEYDVVLSDEGAKWTQEHAARLLATLGTLPSRPKQFQYTDKPFRKSKWVLTDQYLADDITIERSDAGDTVRLSSAVFVYATPRLVYLDGVPGRFFSKRLHHAALRFATRDGADSAAAAAILLQRFGVQIDVAGSTYMPISYQQLTGEGASSFATFRPQELLELISAMEEMPEGFYTISGLNYLLRRPDGWRNKVNPAIIAQARPEAGYIELSERALTASPSVSPQRVILHEKTHFLWAKVFSSTVKNDWTALGGWYRNPADTSAWLTSKSFGFVSAYAHATGPDEDMAESVADYILNPALLQSRAIDKYTFIRDRIFKGDLYVLAVREDLTFTVVDLAPDYTAPGKIKSIDIALSGAPTDDKTGTISVELFGDASPSAGAQRCYGYFLPPSGQVNRTVPAYLYSRAAERANDGYVNRTTLSGTIAFNRFAESGYWRLQRMECVDITGNTRYLNASDAGNAAIYVNSPLASSTPPEYEPGSMSVMLVAPLVVEGHNYQQVQASWRIKPHPLDQLPMDATATLQDVDTTLGRINASASYDKATRTMTATFAVPDYFRNGHYGIGVLQMYDAAANRTMLSFPDPASNEAARWVAIVNDHPDGGAYPELDLNRITVVATPTQPAAPNGATIVTVAFYARDDASGLDLVAFDLLNPQGESAISYFHVDKTKPGLLADGWFRMPGPFPGDPTAWRRYEATITLPVGSVPGKWGIRKVLVEDKAGFGKYHDFTELLHFVVSDK